MNSSIQSIDFNNILNPVITNNVFNVSECEDIIKQAKGKGFYDATLSNELVDHTIRHTNIKYLDLNTSDNVWIAKKIVPLIISTNNKVYNFRITEIKELHLLEYKQNYFYDWHLDLSGRKDTSIRKLSFVVFLSDEKTYNGGNLRFEVKDKNVGNLPMQQGSMIIFPSFLIHKVTPVTSGTRYSLVGWVHGPQFQ